LSPITGSNIYNKLNSLETGKGKLKCLSFVFAVPIFFCGVSPLQKYIGFWIYICRVLQFIYLSNLSISYLQVKFECDSSTKFGFSLRGRQNAIVIMTDSSVVARSFRSTSFGYFRFDNVEVSETYVFQVNSNLSTFAPQVITVNEDFTGLNFTTQ